MFNENETKVFIITLKKVIERLSTVKDCDINNFKDTVIEQFDDYNYEGEEELKGLNFWVNISNDGEYKLTVSIDHKDAYELTLFVKVLNKKATIYNVL